MMGFVSHDSQFFSVEKSRHPTCSKLLTAHLDGRLLAPAEECFERQLGMRMVRASVAASVSWSHRRAPTSRASTQNFKLNGVGKHVETCETHQKIFRDVLMGIRVVSVFPIAAVHG
ncbi:MULTISPECIES: hypothetical protein [Ralstonia solanacearum species complex]|uniref:hypothetical protein n=1 Tax=Ralstonia solanacearum species complex TaxID=3116862 RepID=UPI0013A659BE|nr:hypothetical protein [Ralstonia solanacearum]